MDELIFLKLGGSLITIKDQPHTVRAEVLDGISLEIAEILKSHPGLRLIIGHGSGSFGHIPASRFRTRDGVKNSEQWSGFVKVWNEARSLNQLVMDSLIRHNIPAISFSPCSQILADRRQILQWDTANMESALHHSLVPVIYGDVVFDRTLGGTILSTEELFRFLAAIYKPARIVLAGFEPGIWRNFPQRDEIIPSITPSSIGEVSTSLFHSKSPDVTGGMKSKVEEMMDLIRRGDTRQVVIFSGTEKGNLVKALSGKEIGTRITLS